MNGDLWDWQTAWDFTFGSEDYRSSGAVDKLSPLLDGLLVTLEGVLFGMASALVLGLVWAICRRSRIRFVSWPAAAIVEFFRGTPLLIQLFFWYFVLPAVGVFLPAFLTGILGLGLYYSAYTSEVYRAGIEGIPRGQWQAARALNLSGYQTYRYVIMPQAIPPIIPAMGNYLIAMFKDTPMLSAITVLEILQQAKNFGNANFRYLEPLTIVGLTYLVLSLVSGMLVGRLEKRLKLEKDT